jgi:phage gp16-like protein
MIADALRQKHLAQIHIAKKALQLDDDAYRDLLFSVAHVRSASDLDQAGRRLVLEHFRKCGWKNESGRPADPQSRKIRSLWLQLRDLGALTDPGERALRAYVRRIAGVDRLEWLDGGQARTVIETLKQWVARIKAERKAGGDE